jgi:hypothetical protein
MFVVPKLEQHILLNRPKLLQVLNNGFIASSWIAKSFRTSLVYVFALGGSAFAQNGCLNSVSELGAKHIQTRWRETTASDNLPLIISIANGKNGLTYTAIKNGQLWLHGTVSVCLTGGRIVFTLSNTKATKNVPMISRAFLPPTLKAQVVNGHINLKGGSWSGTFVGIAR